MSHLVRHLTIPFVLAACTVAAAQQAVIIQSSPQVQPDEATSGGNSPRVADISGPAPLRFALLSGSTNAGQLTLVVPHVIHEKTHETRTRTTPVVKDGKTHNQQQSYTVEIVHFKVVTTARPVQLQDIFRWDGAAAVSAAAELVQKFIDARMPVILIENQGTLTASPMNQAAIRRGALLVQLPAAFSDSESSALPESVPLGTQPNIQLPKDPPPQLVTVGRSHGAPTGAQPSVSITRSTPVPITKQVQVEVESNGLKRTETREVREIIWKPEFEQVQADQLKATDKSGKELTQQELWQRIDQPTVCVDSRTRPFDSVYLLPLSETTLVLRPTGTAPPATAASRVTAAPPAGSQSAPRGERSEIGASATAAPGTWVGRTVVPQPNIQLKAAGTNRPLEWRSLGALPWKVTHEKDDWLWIGKTWVSKDQVIPVGDSEHDRQLIKFGEAVRREPKNAWNYVNRSYFWTDIDHTLADLDEALRLNNDPYIVHARLHALQRAGQWQAVLEGWNAQLRANPQGIEALTNRALILAASPEDSLRNGRQAVTDATQACELAQWNDPRALDALAAAYAETGDFASAIKWKEKANELHQKSLAQPELGNQDPNFARMLNAPLELYRQGKPFRLEATSQTAGAPSSQL